MASNTKASTTKPIKGDVTDLPADTYSPEQMRALFEVSQQMIDVVPGMKDLMSEAAIRDWDGAIGKAIFNARLQELFKSWVDPEGRPYVESARTYLIEQAEGSADFGLKRTESSEYVRRTAMQLGVNLSDDQISKLSEKSLMFGWGREGNTYLLQRAIAETEPEGEFGGDIGKNAQALRTLAMVNGVKFSEGFFTSAGKSVATGLTLPNYWQGQIREQAASRFPSYADQIRAGVNLRDIVSPYIQTMEDEWEVNGNDIMLDDPTLLNGIAGVNETGQQAPMSLGDFARSLRQDERWKNTDKAQNKIAGALSGVFKMFGATK